MQAREINQCVSTSGSTAVLTIANAQTIHRIFRLDTYLSTAIQHESSDFLSVRETAVLIIDEISMMSVVYCYTGVDIREVGYPG